MKTITTQRLNMALGELNAAQSDEKAEAARHQRARELQVHFANHFDVAPGPPLTTPREKKGTSA